MPSSNRACGILFLLFFLKFYLRVRVPGRVQNQSGLHPMRMPVSFNLLEWA